MGSPLILVGDSSTHANTCQQGSAKTLIGGKRVSYVTAAVSADNLGHPPNQISGSGSPHGRTIFKSGHAVACNGAPTSCGATMISSITKTVLG